MTHDHVTSAQVKLRRRVIVAFLIGLLVTANAYQLLDLWAAPSCRNYSETRLDAKALISNVWDHDGTVGFQCIFSDMSRVDHVSAFWLWAWPFRKHDDLPKSSVNITYGRTPWQKMSTSPLLPIRLTNMKAMKIRYAISSKGVGKFVTAIKIYLTTASDPAPQNIDTEIMIWLDGRDAFPWAEREGDLQVDRQKFDLWAGKIESWKFLTIRLSNNAAADILDVRAILSALIQRKYIRDVLYLTSVELGDEITQGPGYTIVSDFDVDITRLDR